MKGDSGACLQKLWDEVRILQIQMAMLLGVLHPRSKRRQRTFQLLSDRLLLQELDEIDRRADVPIIAPSGISEG